MEAIDSKLNKPVTFGSLIVLILLAIVVYLYVMPGKENLSYTSGATMRFLQEPTSTNMGDGKELDFLEDPSQTEEFTHDKPPGQPSHLDDQKNSEEALAQQLYEGMQNNVDVEPDMQVYNELGAMNQMF